MTNNQSIQILRGNQTNIDAAVAGNVTLLPGQMLYNEDKNTLVVGSSTDGNLNKQPIISSGVETGNISIAGNVIESRESTSQSGLTISNENVIDLGSSNTGFSIRGNGYISGDGYDVKSSADILFNNLEGKLELAGQSSTSGKSEISYISISPTKIGIYGNTSLSKDLNITGNIILGKSNPVTLFGSGNILNVPSLMSGSLYADEITTNNINYKYFPTSYGNAGESLYISNASRNPIWTKLKNMYTFYLPYWNMKTSITVDIRLQARKHIIIIPYRKENTGSCVGALWIPVTGEYLYFEENGLTLNTYGEKIQTVNYKWTGNLNLNPSASFTSIRPENMREVESIQVATKSSIESFEWGEYALSQIYTDFMIIGEIDP